jgi:hypothetical protein
MIAVDPGSSEPAYNGSRTMEGWLIDFFVSTFIFFFSIYLIKHSSINFPFLLFVGNHNSILVVSIELYKPERRF